MTIAIRKLIIPATQRKVTQGQSVNVQAQIVDSGVIDSLLDPTSLPLLSIFNPSSVAVITDLPMTRVSTGLYSLPFQTDQGNPIGTYTADITVFNAMDSALLNNLSIFDIIATSSFITATFLSILDQSGVTWYWFIDLAQELASSSVIPTTAGTASITTPSVPSWIELDDELATTWFVYPDISTSSAPGEFLVASVQPTNGVGFDAGTGLQFIAFDRVTRTLKVNSAQELFVI